MITNERVRVVIQGCPIETTVDKIQSTLVRKAWDALCKMRQENKIKPIGLTGIWDGVNIQIDIL